VPALKNKFMPQDREHSKAREEGQEQNSKNPQKKSSANMEQLSDNTDLLARRDEQSHDYKGESQDVNDDSGRPLNEDELDHARNKATQRSQQSGEGQWKDEE
jgi:hypothetical protein